MGKRPKKQIKTGWLVAALLAVIAGGVIFMGAVSGWFGDSEVKLDEEYYCGTECQRNFIELSEADYEKLLEEEISGEEDVTESKWKKQQQTTWEC